MTGEPKLPKEALDEINTWLPTVHPLWKRLIDRTVHGFFLPEGSQYLHLAAVCLHDLADALQTSTKALWWAKHEWLRVAVYQEKPDVQWAVHFSRFYFDYAAIALSAASNHLASSMWHLAEKVNQPLGRGYKSAAGARQAWKRQPIPPQCLAILEGLLEDEAWRLVSGYRDQWVHRGLPIIAGEIRQARREIWQSADDPPPRVPWLMKHETGNGRVSYFVQSDEPQHDMPQLLDRGAAAAAKMMSTVEAFLPLYDAAYREHGVDFEDENKTCTTH